MFKNEDILNPTGYIPTSHEIALAKSNHVMKNYIYGMLENFSTFYEIKNSNKIHSDEKLVIIEKRLDSDYKKWNRVKTNWKNGNLFDQFISDEDFNHYFVKALSSMHLGDCTSFPMTCDRCYAESLFKIPYSATFSQKEGAVLLDEFLNDYKEKTGQDYAIDE